MRCRSTWECLARRPVPIDCHLPAPTALPELLTPLRWILTAVSFLATFGVSAYVIASNWPAEGAPLGLPWCRR